MRISDWSSDVCSSDLADALAHAARQLVRVGLLETLEADLADVALRHRLALGAGDAAQLEAEGDVAQHRRPGHQREVLEHEGALWPRAGNRTAVHPHLAGGRRYEASDDLQQGRLAAARGDRKSTRLNSGPSCATRMP